MSKDHAAGLRAAAQAFLEIIDLVTRRKASVLRPRRRERTRRGVEEIGVRLCPIRVSGVRRAMDKVLEQSEVMRIAQPSYSTRRVKAGGGEHNAL
jgi:hypothetical protein